MGLLDRIERQRKQPEPRRTLLGEMLRIPGLGLDHFRFGPDTPQPQPPPAPWAQPMEIPHGTVIGPGGVTGEPPPPWQQLPPAQRVPFSAAVAPPAPIESGGVGGPPSVQRGMEPMSAPPGMTPQVDLGAEWRAAQQRAQGQGYWRPDDMAQMGGEVERLRAFAAERARRAEEIARQQAALGSRGGGAGGGW